MKTLYLYHQELDLSSQELQGLIKEYKDAANVLHELSKYDARFKQKQRYRAYTVSGKRYWYRHYQAISIPDDMLPAFLLRWM